MDNGYIELVGAPCGTHGPYTFYKAFKYNKSGKQNILALNEFVFIKLWSDSDLVSIGELQQLWVDKNSEQTLASLRLYILPENTPEGRTDIHGEHEVLAISDRVVIRCEDLLTWLTEDASWSWGLPAVWDKDCSGLSNGPPTTTRLQALSDTCMDFTDIEEEKFKLDPSTWDNCGVVVLSFPRYCRYRALMKRLEGVPNKWLRNSLVTALGGFSVPCRDTRVLFCKDTFDYPDLEGHELLCNHLAPKINLRSKKKKKKQSTSPGETDSNESESSLSTISSSTKDKRPNRSRNGLQYDLSQPNRRHKSQSQEEKMFLDRLHHFMNDRQTPIGKVPMLGFKEMDLYKFFSKVQHLGGYDNVSANRMWPRVFDEMGGDPANTSATTHSKRHYERLLLPYERKLRSDALSRAGISSQDYEAWIESLTSAADLKDGEEIERRRKMLIEGTTAALRSIRLKPEKSSDLTGKENIPILRLSELADPSRSVHSPEVIVLDSESETPIKNITTPMVPVLKKRKLDMLKEGGLEVTPIGSPGSSSSGQTDATANVKPAASPETPPGEVSIMVTPDLSHMLGSPKAGSPETCASPLDSAQSSPANPRTVINVQDLKNSPLLMYPGVTASQNGRSDQSPPKVTQSRSIYANSALGGPWYGNPKDYPRPGGNSNTASTNTDTPPIARSLQAALRVANKSNSGGSSPVGSGSGSGSGSVSGIDVLDLRMKGEKPAVEIVRVMPSVSAPPPRQAPIRDSGRANVPPQVLPSSIGRTTVGSNLEITLVQNPKLAIAKLQQEQRNVLLQQRRVAQQQAKASAPSSRPSPRIENGRPHSVATSTSNTSRSRPPSVNNTPSSSSLVIPSPYVLGNNSNSSSTNSSNSSNNSKRRNSNDQRSRASTNTPTSSAPTNPYFSGAAANLFPNLLQNLPTGSAAAGKNAFLPALDLMYYQALCNPQLYNPAAASVLPMSGLPMSTPQHYMPTEEQFQLYKNILSHQLKSNPAQASEDIARLLQDGSTSITLVGNSKNPTSK